MKIFAKWNEIKLFKFEKLQEKNLFRRICKADLEVKGTFSSIHGTLYWRMKSSEFESQILVPSFTELVTLGSLTQFLHQQTS